MKNENSIDTIEKVFIKVSQKIDCEPVPYKSVSRSVMTKLREEKLIDEDYENIWAILVRPLAVSLALACFALISSVIYFSSNIYDDKMIELFSNNNEQELYAVWEGILDET